MISGLISFLHSRVSRIRKSGPAGLSYQDVLAAYRCILGRQPESVEATLRAAKEPLPALVRSLFRSEEFANRIARPLIGSGVLEAERLERRLDTELRDDGERLLLGLGADENALSAGKWDYGSVLALLLQQPSVASGLQYLTWSPGRLIEVAGKARVVADAPDSTTYNTVIDFIHSKTASLKATSSSGVEFGDGAEVLRLTSNDPWIQFSWSPSEKAAFLVIEFDVEPLTSPAMRQGLYLDYGAGFTEARYLTSISGGKIRFVIFNPMILRNIRWDPDSQPGEFRLHAIHARLAGPSEVGVPLGAYLLPNAPATTQLQHGLETLVESFAQVGVGREEIAHGWSWVHHRMTAAHGASADGYYRWMQRVEQNDAEPLLTKGPEISIIMPIVEDKVRHLRESLNSVLAQSYETWSLHIVTAGLSSLEARSILAEYQKLDVRITVSAMKGKIDNAQVSNHALCLVKSDWVLDLHHEDCLATRALACLAQAIEANPQGRLFYSDEDKISSRGVRFDPYFKPQFSIINMRSQNMLSRLTAYRTEDLRTAGGFRPGFEDSQDYDISLRVIEAIGPEAVIHMPRVLYHRRASSGSMLSVVHEKPNAQDSGLKALQEHLSRTGSKATVVTVPGTPYFHITPVLSGREPKASLIIPTKDRADLLRVCVRSILERTDYYNYEIIIVDNGSEETNTFELFNELDRESHIQILSSPGPFNYSKINNDAVKRASGEVIGLVNNDIEVISSGWLREMLSWASQPDVGCVGAKLYYSDDSIQHAGVIVGLGGVAGHSHKHSDRANKGYFGRLVVAQELSAVTAACLLVRKSIYDEVGGLNEELAVAFNDVDFCLRVQKAGYHNVFTPFAELYHHESVSRGVDDDPEKLRRFQGEISYMKNVWKTDGYIDPFYSPHLTYESEDFTIS